MVGSACSAALISVLSLLTSHLAAGEISSSFGFVHPNGGRGDASRITYHGMVDEDSTDVLFNPPIRTHGELICKFEVVHHHNQPQSPFEISIEDQQSGLAKIRAKDLLNCEEQKEYWFHIDAISCSGTYATRARVHVEIADKNEFAPAFATESVHVSINEGEMIEELTQVVAEDKDCSDKFGKICSYVLESENQPFEISKDGFLKNTRPLKYDESHSYVLSIVANDCGDKKSAPILVIVEVKQPCKTGWNGLSSQVNYVPSTGPQPLFPHATLNLCPEDTCKPQKLESTLYLETRHVGKGCDRDTYTLASQRRLCGANEEAVELLPEEAKNMRDEAKESDKSITRFDGKTGFDITDTTDVLDAFPGSVFTLATWMKHEEQDVTDKHHKEHIICTADDHKKNRHHMALFVRNCKLVLLLRKEFSDGEENIFRPAEWRWKLPQVCDNEWHHYAINVNFPKVELVVDGDKWSAEKDNPEIIDDWPLHPVAGITTRTSVGACWQGAEEDFKHELTGYLAGLSILRGSNENTEVLRCLHQCAESLQVPASSSLPTGMEMVTDKRGSRVIVDGPDGKDLTKLMEQVAYLNTREFPAPGKRIVNLSTKLTCEDGHVMHLREQKSFVNVIEVPEPKIDIKGTSDISREYDDFKLGVRIFADVHILMTTGSTGNGEPVNGIENRLDECIVSVSPPLNGDHEHFDVPEDLLKSLKITGKVSSQGATFRGAEMIYNYERLLRQVTYTNQKPAYYLNRQFKIICSEMNGRFVSNEYSQTLTVIHPSSNEDATLIHKESHSAISSHEQLYDPRHNHRGLDEQVVDEVGYETRQNFFHNMQGQAAHGNVVAVVAVVCVGFMAVLLILGIIRVRASHKRSAAEELQAEVEMAWDDTALNITVNPLQDSSSSKKAAVTTLRENPCPEEDVYDDDSMTEDDDEDEDGFEDDVDEDDEDDLEVHHVRRPHDVVVVSGGNNGANQQRLEWDRSDMWST